MFQIVKVYRRLIPWSALNKGNLVRLCMLAVDVDLCGVLCSAHGCLNSFFANSKSLSHSYICIDKRASVVMSSLCQRCPFEFS